MRNNVLSAVVAMSLQFGCSTSYQPRPTPRVSTVLHNWGVYHVKEGREYPAGLMGGGLAEAVAADPAAMTHVNTARRQLAYGYPAYFLGAAGLITGLIIAGPVGLAVAGGGLIMGGTGAGLIFKSSTHFVDAVNIHNDNVATDSTTSP